MIMSTAPSTQKWAYRLVALGFLVMFFSTSIKSVYQVYFSDLATHFGGSRAAFAWAGSVSMLVTGVMSPVVGGLSDRVGPLRTVFIGALSGGLALLAVSLFPHSLALFVVAYGLVAAFSIAAMTYVPMGVLVDRLFENKNKGFAYAVVTNGTAVGFIVLSPFWIWLQPQSDWVTVFMLTGMVFLGPICALIWWAMRGAASANLAQPAAADPTASQSTSQPTPPPMWQQIRNDPGFYVLALGFFGCGSTMAFIDVHLVSFWQDGGTSRAQMGLSLSMLGVLELVSGLATGWLAMRYEKHRMLALFYAMRSLAMLMLLSGLSEVSTIGFAMLFGASYLGTVVLTSMYCFERYGSEIKGKVFGLLFLIHQIGAFASVQLGAMNYDAYGNYRNPVLALSLLTIVAAFASWVFLRKATSKESGETTAGAAAVQ